MEKYIFFAAVFGNETITFFAKKVIIPVFVVSSGVIELHLIVYLPERFRLFFLVEYW
jgi:hypothetical protein